MDEAEESSVPLFWADKFLFDPEILSLLLFKPILDPFRLVFDGVRTRSPLDSLLARFSFDPTLDVRSVLDPVDCKEVCDGVLESPESDVVRGNSLGEERLGDVPPKPNPLLKDNLLPNVGSLLMKDTCCET